MIKEQSVRQPNPGRVLPVVHRGEVPRFGMNIETKLEKLGLNAAGYDLVVARAKVPVTKVVPLMREGMDGSLVQVGERETIIDEDTEMLAGVSHIEHTNGSRKTEEKIVHDNGRTHILQSEIETPPHDVEVITIFKRSELISIDATGMVRLHIVDSKSYGDGRPGSANAVEGVMVTVSNGGKTRPQYTYVQAMLRKDGNEITQFQIQSEVPFRQSEQA